MYGSLSYVGNNEFIKRGVMLCCRSSNTVNVLIDNLSRLSGELSNEEAKIVPEKTKIYIGLFRDIDILKPLDRAYRKCLKVVTPSQARTSEASSTR